MRKLFLLFIFLLIGAGAAVWWLKFERQPPEVLVPETLRVIGSKPSFEVVVKAPGYSGLRRAELRLLSQGTIYQLAVREHRARNWIGSGVTEDVVRVEADLRQAGVQEGPALLQAYVETFAWSIVPKRPKPALEREITVDLSPPGIQLISTQHNLRLGGSSVAVFRVTEDADRMGVAVANYYFPAIRGHFTDPNLLVAFFAVPEDLSADARPHVEASDAVGNSLRVELPVRIRERRFPERTLEIDDRFLNRKVPEIASTNQVPSFDEPLKTYLFINGELRRQTEARLRQIASKSAPRPLWDGPFHRQSSSAPMSAFADRRTYKYKGETIDRQTHLGYDLASLSRATVEAAQNGTVVFAGDLGIYGNTVVIDHGLGVFSLYAHLSTIAVETGQSVAKGQALGQTGETGLAGGDHLHFSIMLYGVHVDPVEWWDPKWIRDHVSAKLTMFPNVDKPPNDQAPPS